MACVLSDWPDFRDQEQVNMTNTGPLEGRTKRMSAFTQTVPFESRSQSRMAGGGSATMSVVMVVTTASHLSFFLVPVTGRRPFWPPRP